MSVPTSGRKKPSTTHLENPEQLKPGAVPWAEPSRMKTIAPVASIAPSSASPSRGSAAPHGRGRALDGGVSHGGRRRLHEVPVDRGPGETHDALQWRREECLEPCREHHAALEGPAEQHDLERRAVALGREARITAGIILQKDLRLEERTVPRRCA